MTNTIILEPQSIKDNYPNPLCLVFHGNDSNPQAHAEFWRPLSKSGWLVALPQSSRAGEQPNTFIWNTPGLAEWNLQEVQNCLTEIKQTHIIDLSKIILAGFSMGGGLAIEMVLGGHIAALGFVVVAPYIPYKYVDPQSAYADFVKTQAKRGYCIVGEQDSFAVEGTSALAFRLPNIGISCFVERHSNLEHDYPSDFEKSLSKAVEYVSSK
jgi:poly(3-hydroxybutyrate) depolymerase